jgi:glycosyltransferase involved in cell wall biosynthesis
MKRQPPTFVTLVPGAKNVHLIKDVGMIPFVMHKHYGYDSSLACYQDDDYQYARGAMQGLKLSKIRKLTGNEILDGFFYLFGHARKIDILNLFHFSKQTLLFILMYKFLNPRGKAYLKLDMSETTKEATILHNDIESKLKKLALKKCAYVTVETKRLCNYLNKEWDVEVGYLPNGFYDFSQNKKRVSFQQKENIICTVGRIGAKEKAHEDLLEAFKIASPHIKEWNLHLIGPVEESFKPYIEKYLSESPGLKSRIVFSGNITDRLELDAKYAKAKIFCLTSKWESFGLVLVEAIQNGCFVISSNVPAAGDITDNQKYGAIFPKGDVAELARLLKKSCSNEGRLAELCPQIQDFAYANFDWIKICDKLNERLDGIIISYGKFHPKSRA